MQAITITPETRPNRLDGTKKDRDYHIKYARYATSAGFGHPFHQSFLVANTIFWNFYKGNQWVMNEDLDTFLMDESGNARNRIKLCENIIAPMIRQWVGNAIKMDFNAKAFNISPYAKTRKEEQLSEMLLMTKIGNFMGGGVKKDIQAQYGTGETEEETKELFENYYVDCYTKAINNLLRWSKDRNRFDNAIIALTEFMGVTGMGVHKGYYCNGEQQWDVIDPNFFFWDRGARRPDLKDAGFMGEYSYAYAPDLYENYQNLTDQERIAIEKFTKQSSQIYAPQYSWLGTTQDRLFKATTYWKDCDKQEFGYVIDKYGEECLTQINVKDEDGDLKKDSYTDKDLIYPVNENYQRFLGKNKKKTMYMDVLRYCIFTPREICGVLNSSNAQDIVYEYGMAPYQETNTLNPSDVEFPYKCETYLYHNGEVISPIQDAISPQRMINRALSATDAMMNNSRLSGTVIDLDAVDPQDGESGVLRKMNLGQPLVVDSKRMGVTNVVGQYNNSIGNNMSPFMDYVGGIRQVVQNTIGVNEAMTGAGGRSSDLVGVKKLQVAQGSLIQEKFYARVKDILLQTFQSVASQGKRIYADSRRKLSMIVGDEGAYELEITKDMNLEDFRVFIHTAMPDEDAKAEAQARSVELFQLGLLGDKQVADVWGRGDLTEVGRLMREFANEKTMAAAMKQKADQQAQEIAEQKMQEQVAKQDQIMQIGLDEEQKDRDNQIKKVLVQGQLKSSHIKEQNQGKLADTIVGANLENDNIHTQNMGKISDTIAKGEYDLQKEKMKPKPDKKAVSKK